MSANEVRSRGREVQLENRVQDHCSDYHLIIINTPIWSRPYECYQRRSRGRHSVPGYLHRLWRIVSPPRYPILTCFAREWGGNKRDMFELTTVTMGQLKRVCTLRPCVVHCIRTPTSCDWVPVHMHVESLCVAFYGAQLPQRPAPIVYRQACCPRLIALRSLATHSPLVSFSARHKSSVGKPNGEMPLRGKVLSRSSSRANYYPLTNL